MHYERSSEVDGAASLEDAREARPSHPSVAPNRGHTQGERAGARWHFRLTRPFLALSLLLASSAAGMGEVRYYDVSIQFSRINEDNHATLESTSRLTVAFDEKSQQWRFDDLSEGTHIASQKDFILQQHAGGRPQEPDLLVVSLGLNDYPIDTGWAQRLAWFAYCARPYLEDKDNQPVIVPAADTRWDFYVHCCRAKMRWRAKTDTCPQEVQFVFDKELFKKSIERLDVQPQGNVLISRAKLYQAFKKSYTNGTLVALFKVNAWKEAAGHGVPDAWMLEVYWFGQLSYRCLGTTLKASLARDIDPIAISATATVQDFRVRNAGLGVNYIR